MDNSNTITVPGFQHFMIPFLKVLANKEVKHIRTIIEDVSKLENLTPEQCAVKLPSQSATLVVNRVAWVRTYLFKAGLINQISRGNYIITEAGLKCLLENPNGINIKFLRTLTPFQNWMSSFGPKSIASSDSIQVIGNDDDRTPQENLDIAFNSIMGEVAFELLERVKKSSPAFFENLVVDVLMAMGYGGFDESNGQVTQYSGDGGIDGIIKEDKLGLDTIYIQAKRWENTVTISAVRDFAGSLLSKKARKGVFITTSTFPQSAYEYVKSIDPTIILIDGVQLTKLMIDYNVAVSKSKVYEIKRIDNDYFEI
jgi:restriction system protein